MKKEFYVLCVVCGFWFLVCSVWKRACLCVEHGVECLLHIACFTVEGMDSRNRTSSTLITVMRSRSSLRVLCLRKALSLQVEMS